MSRLARKTLHKLRYQLAIINAASEHLKPGHADLLDTEDVLYDEDEQVLFVCCKVRILSPAAEVVIDT
jgi:hypothetical protein